MPEYVACQSCSDPVCQSCTDSVEHMLLQCCITRDLWGGVRDWIVEIGMLNYNLSDTRIILCDMENAVCINSIILLTKKSHI